jgi:hypothetical protein
VRKQKIPAPLQVFDALSWRVQLANNKENGLKTFA